VSQCLRLRSNDQCSRDRSSEHVRITQQIACLCSFHAADLRLHPSTDTHHLRIERSVTLPSICVDCLRTLDTLHQSPLAQALTIALQSRRSTADISHILSLPSTPVTMLHDTLFGTLTSYDVNTRLGSTNTFSMVDVMGAAVEIYR
jgi:hypothetical protein